MDVFLNRGTGLLVRGVGLSAVVSSMTVKARDTLVLDVWVFRGSELEDLSAGSSLAFLVKTGVKSTDATLAVAEGWEQVEDETGHYRAALNLNTVPLVAAVADLDEISAVGELSWSADGVAWQSSNTVRVTIANDVFKGSEGTPDELPTPDDNWVAHGHPQTLTAEQKLTARENIGVEPIIRTAAEGSPDNSVTPTAIGQKCFVGDTPPYDEVWVAESISPPVWVQDVASGGPAETTSSILLKLQGAALNPDKIGAEFLTQGVTNIISIEESRALEAADFNKLVYCETAGLVLTCPPLASNGTILLAPIQTVVLDGTVNLYDVAGSSVSSVSPEDGVVALEYSTVAGWKIRRLHTPAETTASTLRLLIGEAAVENRIGSEYLPDALVLADGIPSSVITRPQSIGYDLAGGVIEHDGTMQFVVESRFGIFVFEVLVVTGNDWEVWAEDLVTAAMADGQFTQNLEMSLVGSVLTIGALSPALYDPSMRLTVSLRDGATMGYPGIDVILTNYGEVLPLLGEPVGRLCYVQDPGVWYRWDGTEWVPDSSAIIIRTAAEGNPDSPNIPDQYVLTGTMLDASNNPIPVPVTLDRVADAQGHPSWEGGGWRIMWANNDWLIFLIDGGYSAITSALSGELPHDPPTFGWIFDEGSGDPVLTPQPITPLAIGQKCFVGDAAPYDSSWTAQSLSPVVWVQDSVGPAGPEGPALSLGSALTLFGLTSYADLTAANAALPIGRIYYDQTLNTLNVTTA
jgi:hypothetical protein